jgi:hypothetical protein
VVVELRRAAAEAQALEGGRQARRLGRATACLAEGRLTATEGLQTLRVDQALGAIAEREAALEVAKRKSRRWSVEEEESVLHDESVQQGRMAAAEAACVWLNSAMDSRPRDRQWIAQCGRIAAAERVAAQAALTAATSRGTLARQERDRWHSYVAQAAGLCRARQVAQAAAAGASGRFLNTAHHRAWREALSALRRQWEFEQLLAQHSTERAACSLGERTAFLNTLHGRRGEIMARNVVDQPNIAAAQHMNEQLALQIESAMCGTAVASLLPTIKWHDSESGCREGIKKALQMVADERERCAIAEMRACESACSFGRDAEEAAKVERARAQQRLEQGRESLAAAQASVEALRTRLAELEDLERAKGRTQDTTVRTVEGLEKTDSELTRSWTNLEDAIKAEMSGEVVTQWQGTAGRKQYQLKKPMRMSPASPEDKIEQAGAQAIEKEENTKDKETYAHQGQEQQQEQETNLRIEPEVIELGSESTSEEEVSPVSSDGDDSPVKALEILQGLGRPQLPEEADAVDEASGSNRAPSSPPGAGADADADVDELRLMLIPSAEATVEDCHSNVTSLEKELAAKQSLVQEKMKELEAAEAARVRALRDHGREALYQDALKESQQLGAEIAALDSSLTEFDIAEREVRYANGALEYVMQASALADSTQSPERSVEKEDQKATVFRGVRTRQAPPQPSSLLPWVREGMHVSDYIADYSGAGRQLRLEFIAHHAGEMVARLAQQGFDELAKKHEKLELDACRILMDDLKSSCQTMVAMYATYVEADAVLTAAKQLYKEGRNLEDDRKMNRASEDMEEVLPVVQVAREQMMRQRVDAPLYRAIATQVDGRLGADYYLDEKDDKVRVCTLSKKAAVKAQSDAEAALQKAKDDAKAAAKEAKDTFKEHGRTKYSAERAEAAGEEAYKKEDYKKERECRATAKELWAQAEKLEATLVAAQSFSKEQTEAVDAAKAAVAMAASEVAAADKALHLTAIEAKDGWLAKSDQAVACVETFCTNQHLVDAGLKINHGDAVGAASSFVHWRKQLLSSSSRRKTNGVEFTHGLDGMVAALASIVQHDLPSAQDCAEHRSCIVSVRCPKDTPKDGRFVAVERKSFAAADGSPRVDGRHKPFGDYSFEYPAKELMDKELMFKTKVPMAVAARAGELEGLAKQDALNLIDDLSVALMNSPSSPATEQHTGSDAEPAAAANSKDADKKQLQVSVPQMRTFAETSQILACRGLYCLLHGEFATAADLFLNVRPRVENSRISSIFSDCDVGLCATLCSLASLSLAEIQERLLCEEFEKFLVQTDPIVRELICEFISGNFRALKVCLDGISVRMAYDPFICEHRASLVDAIRARCCQFATPFVDNEALLSVKCRERAAASLDSARFRCSAMAAAAELDVVKGNAVAAQKAASRALAKFHELIEDTRDGAKTRNIFSRASAKGIAQKRFEVADADNSGTVDMQELEKIAESLGRKLTPQQLRRVVEEVDVDGNGQLDYSEFMVWYTKEFGEKLQMSEAHEARARVAMLTKTAQAELEIARTKQAAEEAQKQVTLVAAEVAEVRKNEEDAARSRQLQAQRRVVRANMVLYYHLPSAADKTETQHAANLMLQELEIDTMEAQLLDELNVSLSCIQRRHETATGGIFFQRDFDTEIRERAVLEEVAAGGWSVEGISLVGYLRASTETDVSLLYLGSSVGAELARRIANRRLADAEAARTALGVLLQAEQATVSESVTRVSDKISAKTKEIELSREAALALLETELEKATAAQGQYSAAELNRRRTKQTQRAMQALLTAREQRADRQTVDGALDFLTSDRERKNTDTATAQEQEWKSLSAMAAAQLADAREIHAGAVVEREKKEDDYEKMRDQLTQELEERNQLRTVAKVSEREAKLQAKLLADATSQYDKRRIGSDKVDAEAVAAQDASKAQRQVELTIVVSEKTDEVKQIMLAARKEEETAAAAIEECHAAERHANETRAEEWAEHARQKELREGPLFVATVDQLQQRLQKTQTALDAGKASLQEQLRLAMQSQADFLRQHALQRLLHRARRLRDEQATERLKERNHTVLKKAALARQVWADKSDLFHMTDERALADERAAEKEKTRAAAAATHSAASAELSASEVYCLQTKETFTDTKLARSKVEYLLEREEATLARLQRDRSAGRPASASAVAKWRADLERLTGEVGAQEVLYAEAAARLERATTALEQATEALQVAAEEAEVTAARAAAAAKKEMDVQQAVAAKLEALVQSGLVFTSERSENEFKSLLFRKILDGALGCKWNKQDEKRFQELFCGEHLRGPTSQSGLRFKKIRT